MTTTTATISYQTHSSHTLVTLGQETLKCCLHEIWSREAWQIILCDSGKIKIDNSCSSLDSDLPLKSVLIEILLPRLVWFRRKTARNERNVFEIVDSVVITFIITLLSVRCQQVLHLCQHQLLLSIRIVILKMKNKDFCLHCLSWSCLSLLKV